MLMQFIGKVKKKNMKKTAIVMVAYNTKQYLALQNQQKPENIIGKFNA